MNASQYKWLCTIQQYIYDTYRLTLKKKSSFRKEKQEKNTESAWLTIGFK